MTEQEKILFNKLKQEVANTFLKENSALSNDISQWKGDDIVRFQEDLLAKVKGQVSEKWFYNYFRNDIQKLPRIDMLNLLSEYAGYQNWADFKQKNKPREIKKIELNKKHLTLFVLLIIAGLMFSWTFLTTSTNDVQLCFVDESINPIDEPIKLVVISEKNEKIYTNKNTNCIKFKTKQENIKIKILSSYYLQKTIDLNVEKDYNEQVMLITDIYALMLRHYSNDSPENRQQKKHKLEELIADDAVIYQQWFGKNKGIEIYTKDEFVAQMTVPTNLLKHIEIIDKAYKDGKISRLRFTVKQ